MALMIREGSSTDLAFLRSMLYEAVYWRSLQTHTNPAIEDGLAAPGVGIALEGWGREGDTAVICSLADVPVGAAWYRKYQEPDTIRGYIDHETPVLVLAVHEEHRRCGIGTKLLRALLTKARDQSVPRISLMVSQDNPAYTLYRACGFELHARVGDSFLMTRRI